MGPQNRVGEQISHPVALSKEGTLLHGYNQGVFQQTYQMTQVDFERIKYGYSSWRSIFYNFGYIALGSALSVLALIGIAYFDGLGGDEVEPISSGNFWVFLILLIVCIVFLCAGYFFVRDKRDETLSKIEKHFQDTETRPAMMRRDQ